MSAPTLHQLQDAILDAIAPANWRTMGVTGATLQLNAQGLPSLTLTLAVAPSRFNAAPLTRTQRFELRPIDDTPPEQKPLDLDRLAGVARRLIASDVSNLALHAHIQTTTDFAVARIASNARHDAYESEHAESVSSRTPRPWPWARLRQGERLLDRYLEISIDGIATIVLALLLGGLGLALDQYSDEANRITVSQEGQP